MTTDEQSIRKLARIVFKHAYSLGAFSGCNDKMEKGYSMMLNNMIDTKIHDEETKQLLEVLFK